MQLTLNETTIPGCYEIMPKVIEDDRGIFVKTFHRDTFISNDLCTDWQEEYYSVSLQGVLRGLHFQSPLTPTTNWSIAARETLSMQSLTCVWDLLPSAHISWLKSVLRREICSTSRKGWRMDFMLPATVQSCTTRYPACMLPNMTWVSNGILQVSHGLTAIQPFHPAISLSRC